MTAPHALPLPQVRLNPGERKRIGLRPWVYANQLAQDSIDKSWHPGIEVTLADERGEGFATAFFNRHSLIAGRIHSWSAGSALTSLVLADRLQSAEARRTRLFPNSHYRLVHTEGDNLPGLTIDRYGPHFVIQPNIAGVEARLDDLIAVLQAQFAPQSILVRADAPIRALEGLGSYVRLAQGMVDGPVPVFEGRCRFFADLDGGQKTGWFYDLREARRQVASLASGARLLDLYCHTGAFGVRALVEGGAESVLAIDRAKEALTLAEMAAKANGVRDEWQGEVGDGFQVLERLVSQQERFDIVVADPPSFVKSRKDLPVGLKAYRKLARLAAQCVHPGGFLFIASCSHNVSAEAFAAEVERGLQNSERTGRLLFMGGADADHPTHIHLPETAYLKYLILQLD